MRIRDGDFRAGAVGGGFVAGLIGGPSGRVRFAREFRRPRRGFLVRGTVEGGARTRRTPAQLAPSSSGSELTIVVVIYGDAAAAVRIPGEGRERRVRLRRARPRHVVAKRHGNGREVRRLVGREETRPGSVAAARLVMPRGSRSARPVEIERRSGRARAVRRAVTLHGPRTDATPRSLVRSYVHATGRRRVPSRLDASGRSRAARRSCPRRRRSDVVASGLTSSSFSRRRSATCSSTRRPPGRRATRRLRRRRRRRRTERDGSFWVLASRRGGGSGSA